MLKTHNLLSILIVIIGIQSALAQELTSKIIDSTFIELKAKPNSTQKVDDLISLYKKSSRSKIPNEIIIDEAIAVSEKIFYIEGLAKSYDRKGLNARYNFDYGNSITYHKRALNLLNKTTDTFSKVKCLNNLGVTYRKLNLEKEAFNVYFEALDLSEKLKNIYFNQNSNEINYLVYCKKVIIRSSFLKYIFLIIFRIGPLLYAPVVWN